jgi:hypothetical protein
MEEYSYNFTHPLGHTGPVTRTLYLFLPASNWIGHILGRNYLLRHVIAGKNE